MGLAGLEADERSKVITIGSFHQSLFTDEKWMALRAIIYSAMLFG
jgi:hypothetical protein